MTRELIVQLLASITTLISMWFYGSKSLYGPSLAIMGQVFWWIIMFQGKLWGLLPLNIAMAIMHVRNLIKWRADAQRETLQAEGQQASSVPRDREQRRSAKAYQIISGGDLR